MRMPSIERTLTLAVWGRFQAAWQRYDWERG